MTLESFVKWLDEIKGPRLVIVNTVQIAAKLADMIAKRNGADSVMHLSTALTPHDRAITLKRVKTRLSPPIDTFFSLVATSCVEAGVDFSFRNGLRQRASLTSLMQILGRVNRESEYQDSVVWDFELVPGGFVNENPGLGDSIVVLSELWKENKIDPSHCTEALEREIRLGRSPDLNRALKKAEVSFDFPEVQRLFRVINQETVTAVVSQSLRKKLESGALFELARTPKTQCSDIPPKDRRIGPP